MNRISTTSRSDAAECRTRSEEERKRPGAERAVGELAELLRTPQYQQALEQLTHALSGGELAALLAQLGLPMPDDATFARLSPVEVFIRAFVAKHREN